MGIRVPWPNAPKALYLRAEETSKEAGVTTRRRLTESVIGGHEVHVTTPLRPHSSSVVGRCIVPTPTHDINGFHASPGCFETLLAGLPILSCEIKLLQLAKMMKFI